MIINYKTEGKNRRLILSNYNDLHFSFVNVAYEKDNDMRFVYCASAICYILNDWSGIDVEKMIDFIKQSLVCFTFDFC